MLFKKLFQVLVLGGVVATGETGCAANADTQPTKKTAQAKDGGTQADAGTKQADTDTGSGVQGW